MLFRYPPRSTDIVTRDWIHGNDEIVQQGERIGYRRSTIDGHIAMNDLLIDLGAGDKLLIRSVPKEGL